MLEVPSAAATLLSAVKALLRAPLDLLGPQLWALLPERGLLLLGLLAFEDILARGLIGGAQPGLSELSTCLACAAGYFLTVVIARPAADLVVARRAQGASPQGFGALPWRSLAALGLCSRLLPALLWLSPPLYFLGPVLFLPELTASGLIERLAATVFWLSFLGPAAIFVALASVLAPAALAFGDVSSGLAAIATSARVAWARPISSVGLFGLLAGTDLLLTWVFAAAVPWSGPAIESLWQEQLLALLPRIMQAQQAVVLTTALSAATFRGLQQIAWASVYVRGKSAKPT